MTSSIVQSATGPQDPAGYRPCVQRSWDILLQASLEETITAALHGEITLKDGRVEQTNFDTYQMLRMNEAPAIEVHVVQSSEPPGGMGEPGTSAIAPAVTNAIFAATGKRLRRLPVDTTALKQPA